MARPDNSRRIWRFRLNEDMVLDLSAGRGPTEKQVRRRGRIPIVLVILATALAVSAVAGGTVWTDQPDYPPGSVVTISGDNSNGAGYEPGETVVVQVMGPNGYEASCEAVADASGAWSCQVILWDSELAEGTYSYTATGLTSGATESGAFTDHGPSPVTDDNYSISANASHLLSLAIDLGGGSTSPTAVTLTAATMKVANVTDGGTTDVVLTSPGSTTGNGTWTGSLQGVCGKTYKINNVVVTWTTTHGHTSTETPSSGEGVDQVATNTCPPTNSAPVVTANNDSFSEGTAKVYTASWTDADAGQTHTCTVDFGDGSGPVAGTVPQAQPSSLGTCTASHTYDDGPNSHTITVAVSDGTTSGTDTAQATVTNVDPTAAVGNSGPVDEGSSTTISFSGQSDPSGADTSAGLHYAYRCDGTAFPSAPTYAGTAGGSASTSCGSFPDGPGTHTVRARIIDKDDGWSEYTTTVTVDNVAPTIALSGAASVNEGSLYSLTLGTITDPGIDTVTSWIVDWGDGSPAETLGTGGVKTHTYADGPATPTISVDLVDEDGTHQDAGTKSIAVDNVDPVINSFTCPMDPIAVNTPVALSGAFSDVGTADTHTATIAWDDGSTTSASVNQSADTASGSHAYSAAGIYTPTLTVTDDDSGSDSQTCEYVVVYDPSAGFVTGGGWINSPAGAYMADPSMIGKANFGFVSKYKKGATTPEGHTEFQFHAAGLNFSSASYQWLVVSGAKATYKGVGKINGSGNYGFLLSAIDGQLTGGGGADKFRIKIWDKNAADDTVYDNLVGGGGDDANPTTTLGGGSIVIHVPKK